MRYKTLVLNLKAYEWRNSYEKKSTNGNNYFFSDYRR